MAQAGNRVVISRRARNAEIQARPASNPLSGLGFFSYRYYSPDAGWTVVVSAGAVHVIVATERGGYESLTSGVTATMPAQTVDSLFPGIDGFIVFTYAASMDTVEPGEPGRAGNPAVAVVDFGDPAGDYSVGADIGQIFQEVPDPLVNTENNGPQAFAVIFTSGPPSPSPHYFQRILARVVTSASGVPTVYPVHVGDIEVPKAAEGQINAFRALLAD